MTLPGQPDRRPASGAAPSYGTGRSDGAGTAAGPDPERVLEQALRAMAGGSKPLPGGGPMSGGGPQSRTELPTGARPDQPNLSMLQIVLIATIVGLLVGVTVGLVTLLA